MPVPVQTMTPSVNLASNLLKELPQTVFHPLLSLPAEVDVTDNPLYCGCDLNWLTDDTGSSLTNQPDLVLETFLLI